MGTQEFAAIDIDAQILVSRIWKNWSNPSGRRPACPGVTDGGLVGGLFLRPAESEQVALGHRGPPATIAVPS
ncbi:MAG: hypothetical protein R3D03_14175 [Geminicoccaceae bacterium]